MENPETSNSKQISLVAGIVIFAIGLILIIINKSITGHLIMIIAGALFLLTGIINIILFSTHRKPGEETPKSGYSIFMSWFMSIAAIILGLCMLIFTDSFNAMVPVIFAILIFFGAVILSLSMLVGVRKVLKVPGWTWIFPVAMVALGIVTLLQQATVNDPLIMIFTGAAMIIFGVGAAIVGILVDGARKGIEKQTQQAKITEKTEKTDTDESKKG